MLPACGSQAPAAPQPTGATTTISSAEPSPPGKRQSAVPNACASGLSGFLEGLEHLRRSLVIGVSYEQYVSELGTVRKSYARVPVAKLDLACVSGPATSAESSFDGYLAAGNLWGDCVSESGCETVTLEPELQRKWRLAAKQLADAQRALEGG